MTIAMSQAERLDTKQNWMLRHEALHLVRIDRS